MKTLAAAVVPVVLRVVLFGVLFGACNSSYVPRSRGRIAVIMQNGTPAYVRDGQAHPHGWFGAGLADAVAGNRPAEQAASEYHDRLVDGVLLTTFGAVCMPAALGYALAESDTERGLSRTGGEITGAIALGCAVLLVAGASYAASAEPYRWDAINLFNDGAELPPSAELVPRTAPATSLLEMR